MFQGTQPNTSKIILFYIFYNLRNIYKSYLQKCAIFIVYRIKCFGSTDVVFNNIQPLSSKSSSNNKCNIVILYSFLSPTKN